MERDDSVYTIGEDIGKSAARTASPKDCSTGSARSASSMRRLPKR